MIDWRPVLLALALHGAACRSGADRPPPPNTTASPALPLEEPGRAFVIENAFSHLTFQNPVFAVMPPGRSDLWFVGEREGRVLAVANRPDAREKPTVLDLRASTLGWQDCGLLNLVFHPEFGRPGSPNRGYIYVWYNHTRTPPRGPEQPYLGAASSNRLSRFTVPDGAVAADPASELVLIDQRRSNTDHQGGGMFFHPQDGFLYLAVGDGGHPLTESRGFFWIGVTDDAQRIDRDLLSGLLRIDVDRRGGSVSHPIRRQPRNGRTQGYFIPADNPWLDPRGGVLEEFFAIGLRNPHRATHDPGTGRIFAGDVGDRRIEEVDVLERGGNYQWNFLEGAEPSTRFRRPDRVLGIERGPLHTFTHLTSGSVIGGVVYRGRAFPELAGRYLFADNGSGRVFTLDARAVAPAAAQELLRLPLEMTVYAGLSSFAVDHQGEIYFCILGDNHRGTGTLQKLVRAPAADRPAPASLSATGLFRDTAALTPATTLAAYAINAPFWSDHADKTRWLHVPQDARVGFAPAGNWTFPAGTIAVKHFDLAIDQRDPTRRRRLETRVLVLGRAGRAYGRTYKWRPDGRDADLLTAPLTERLTMTSKQAFVPTGTSALAGGISFAHASEAGDFDLAADFASTGAGTSGLMLRQDPGAETAYVYAAWEDLAQNRPPELRKLRLEHRPRAGDRVAVKQLAVRSGLFIRLQRAAGTLTVFTGEDGHLWQEVAVLSHQTSGPGLVGVASSAESGDRLPLPVRCEVRDHLYPSDGDCAACHTSQAGFVLGASTRQWNRDVTGPDGVRSNQLLSAQRRGLFDRDIQPAQIAGFARLAAMDDRAASVSDRVRSYLDVNCAQCHRPGMVAQVGLDARYDTPLAQQGLVGAPVRWPNVTHPADQMVHPRAPDRSRLYSFVSRRLMPPVGSALVHHEALQLLREWIMELPGPPALGPVAIRRSAGPAPRAPATVVKVVTVEIAHPDPQAAIHFTTDGTGPGPQTPRYRRPLALRPGTTVRAAAFRPGFVHSKLATLELRD